MTQAEALTEAISWIRNDVEEEIKLGNLVNVKLAEDIITGLLLDLTSFWHVSNDRRPLYEFCNLTRDEFARYVQNGHYTFKLETEKSDG